jgi:hypothetical protein
MIVPRIALVVACHERRHLAVDPPSDWQIV